MDRVFSVEEISGHFWSSSSAAAANDSSAADCDNKPVYTMNRSASEWAFQQFLREEVDKKGEDDDDEEEEEKEDLKKKNGCLKNNKIDNINNVPVDSEEYQAFLKNKLNLACAAVAMSRVRLFFFVWLFG